MLLDWESQGVLADFRRCQSSAQATDLVFHCSNGRVFAHQMIFAGISRLFTELMQRFLIGQQLIPLDLNISVPGVLKEHMDMVIEVIYTGQVRLAQSDYAPFRDICQLLELCVPIADYDEFFSAQAVQSTVPSHPSQPPPVPVPVPPQVKADQDWPKPRVFVCDECYAIFPLKIALKRHKKNRHGLPDALEPDLPIQVPVQKKPSVKIRAVRKRSKDSKHSFYPQNGEPTVKCPDCLNDCRPGRAREHLSNHLRMRLMELVTESTLTPGQKKCTLCWYEACSASHVCRHLGLSHNMIMKYASDAQRKFLHEAQMMKNKPDEAECPAQSGPGPKKKRKKGKLSQRKKTTRTLGHSDLVAMEDDHLEIEIDNALHDDTGMRSDSNDT
ncbi:uncharacterized protein LOC131878612 [Tigriopus californicus]|uniref:uncharacterized protein LOC131878612 n=1 Tax=Tigriopus californicus TaxID=6832 RepID=UPI0027D9DFED|nr:uncharacterized protein LOC131878612 [Tigriopus californicus]